MLWSGRLGRRQYHIGRLIITIFRSSRLPPTPTAFLGNRVQPNLRPGQHPPSQGRRQALPSLTGAATGKKIYLNRRGPKHTKSRLAIAQPHRFLKLLFTSKTWQDEQANLLLGLTKKPEAIEATILPNKVPSPEEARLVFNQ